MFKGKKYRAVLEKVDRTKRYSLREAITLAKENHYAKFDETVDMAFRLGVDPRHAEQMVRGTLVLPKGLGKKVRVLVIAKGEKEKEAIEAGADMVGAEEYIEKIQNGWADVDIIIATPDMMGMLGKVAKILGPKGLMPNPKVGTVTFDIARAVQEAKAGKVQFKVDKSGNLHIPIGKVSFSVDDLMENAIAVIDAVLRAKPAGLKGQYLKNAVVTTTMGLSYKLDLNEIQNLVR